MSATYPGSDPAGQARGSGLLQVHPLVAGPLGNNVYVVSAAGHAIVVDAPLDSAEAVADYLAAHDLTLDRIVLTHAHFDHMAEAARLARQTGAPVAIHVLDAPGVEQPRRPLMFPDLQVEPVQPSQFLDDGDQIQVGAVQLAVLHTPGHTPGSICLYDSASATLLSGDTLFAGSYGRVDLPGGDGAALAG